jgi:hypothetical protein
MKRNQELQKLVEHRAAQASFIKGINSVFKRATGVGL